MLRKRTYSLNIGARRSRPNLPILFARGCVDAGIKRQQFRRFCNSEKPAIGGDAVPTLWQFLNLPPENHAARVRQPPVWSNGDAPTVSDPSSHRSISRGSRFATNPNASGVAAAIITARRSLWIPNTAKYAGTALRSGALATRITGGGIASNTRPPSSGTANSSTFGTKNGICAILQTTAQLST